MGGSPSRPAIGIDLGTTFSCVGVYKNGQIEIAANPSGERLTPSEVACSSEEILVGSSARVKSRQFPENTIYHVKRFVGRSYRNVQEDIGKYPFRIANQNGKPAFDLNMGNGRRNFTPEEISAEILKLMKTSAENLLDVKVEDAVITVPAYFNNSQRKATKDAATKAGFNAIRIINEPTAAAMAYVYQNKEKLKGARTLLMFDLGGGTFDVSIVKVTNGTTFEVKATGGDTHLGGADFDERLREHCMAKINEKYPHNEFAKKSSAVKKLLNDCERAKQELSAEVCEASVYIDGLSSEPFKITIRRSLFESLCGDLFDKTIDTLEQTLNDAGIKKSEIDDVVLVGGSTRIPKIQELLTRFFDGKNLKQNDTHPDHAVAYGATVQAVAAFGITKTKFSEVKLRDVTPLTLGLNTGSFNMMSVVIPRNTPIPTKSERSYQPCFDYQKELKIEVFEGEKPKTEDNHRLGEIVLSGFTPDLRDNVKLEVTFSIDADGILTVTAIEKKTKKQASVRIDDKFLSFVETKKTSEKTKDSQSTSTDNIQKYVQELELLLKDDNSSIFNTQLDEE